VNLREGEHLTAAFRKLNPDCTVPVLVLDSGAVINDAIAMCVYFEERHPEPPLIGATEQEKALTIAWNRRVERDGFYAVMEAFRNSTPGLKGRALPGPDDYEQIPALAERGRARVRRFFETLNSRLGDSPFVAGPCYSLADITAQVTIEFAKRAKLTPPESCTYLISWFATVSARPSAKA
jgi:glutathione S-transferase